MAWDPAFDLAFDPRSIAIVGVSRPDTGKAARWGGGAAFIRHLRQAGYQGSIYPINPKANEILGLTCYPNLRALPEPADLVIVAVPAPFAPAVLEECGSTGMRNVHLFTAGFEETGEEEGRRLGEEVRQAIQKHGLRVIGPNGMGLAYVPRVHLASWGDTNPRPGNVAFVSQSGGHTNSFTHFAPYIGVYISKAISYGNGYGFDAPDFLEYLARDPETKAIGFYLEGIRDGRRFLRLVREVNPVKPIVVLKGGLTGAGAQMAASHTGSLAGQAQVWDAFFKQTGAVRVEATDEGVEVMACLLYLPPPAGRRVAVIGGGGGNSVAAADIIAREGLDVPRVSPETHAFLRGYTPPAGNILRNPLDMAAIFQDVSVLEKTLKAVAADPAFDILVFAMNLGWMRDLPENTGDVVCEAVTRLVTSNELGKPLVAALVDNGRLHEVESQRQRLRAFFAEKQVPVFPSLDRAARALARCVGYHERRRALLAEG
ncbi:MAG: CoA-binding protein [Chloroflexi bacterium]|nr:CoA-binding protein [Chloroflexota bacterium]